MIKAQIVYPIAPHIKVTYDMYLVFSWENKYKAKLYMNLLTNVAINIEDVWSWSSLERRVIGNMDPYANMHLENKSTKILHRVQMGGNQLGLHKISISSFWTH